MRIFRKASWVSLLAMASLMLAPSAHAESEMRVYKDFGDFTVFQADEACVTVGIFDNTDEGTLSVAYVYGPNDPGILLMIMASDRFVKKAGDDVTMDIYLLNKEDITDKWAGQTFSTTPSNEPNRMMYSVMLPGQFLSDAEKWDSVGIMDTKTGDVVAAARYSVPPMEFFNTLRQCAADLK